MLHRVGTEHARHAGVKARTEQSRQSRLTETICICPLPAVLKLRRILRLIVRRIDIVHARCEARIHDVQILIWKRKVQHNIGLKFADERRECRHIVRIHGGSLNFCFAAVQFFLECIAF